MARKIKGFKFEARYREGEEFELMKTVKLLRGIYKTEDVKVNSYVYQGGEYTDIYIREGAEKIREVNSMFGSFMNFKDLKTGEINGDTILVCKKGE
jgi:hypothetical protein